MNHTDAELLKQIADLDGVPQGAGIQQAALRLLKVCTHLLRRDGT